jgi:hypothetical protein
MFNLSSIAMVGETKDTLLFSQPQQYISEIENYCKLSFPKDLEFIDVEFLGTEILEVI